LWEKLIKTYRQIFFLIVVATSAFITSVASADRAYFTKGCAEYDFAISCVLGVKVASPKAPERTNFKKDEVVLLYPTDSKVNINDITKKYNLITKSKTSLTSVKTAMLVADTKGKNPLHLSKTINKQEKEVASETNNTFKTAAVSYRKGYPIHEMGISNIHKTTKGRGTTICMIDTPVDIFHPTLSGALIETLDLVKYQPNNSDAMLHGTSVAGVLVSQNSFIGVAPKAKLYAIGAFSGTKDKPSQLEGTSSNIAKAIDSCIQHDVDIINLSFTGGRDSLVERLVKKAIKKGIIVIAAGGNGGHTGSTIYPAQIKGVMATTAVGADNKLFEMADKGAYIDYAAPGVNILTIAPAGKYKIATGTSFASAHLSGLAALLRSKGHTDIDKMFSRAAIDLGKKGQDQEFGKGLISANNALIFFKTK
jgi:subtilisin family serine protease